MSHNHVHAIHARPYMYGWYCTSGQVMTCARFIMGSMVLNSGYGHKFGALDVEHEAPSTEHFNQTEAGCGTDISGNGHKQTVPGGSRNSSEHYVVFLTCCLFKWTVNIQFLGPDMFGNLRHANTCQLVKKNVTVASTAPRSTKTILKQRGPLLGKAHFVPYTCWDYCCFGANFQDAFLPTYTVTVLCAFVGSNSGTCI
jgi:hypothetical protein